MQHTSHPWSVPVALPDIPDTGRRFQLVADEPVRAEVAKLSGVRALPRLEATFEVKRHGTGGLRVTGQVRATVGQNCVVTLEPFENMVEEQIELLFVPRLAQEDDTLAKPVGDDGEETELLTGNTIDLGKIATEFLILGIDPYPRKPGATFHAPVAEDPGAHPFAALAALKKGSAGSDR